MNNYPEVISLSFMSYASISFQAEVSADELSIDWGDGNQSTFPGNPYLYIISHNYQQEGLYTIKITGNRITSLNVSRLSLTELSLLHCPSLEFLDCSINELNILELNDCPVLEELSCNSNNLGELNFTHIPRIVKINSSYNLLKALDFPHCPSLETLQCSHNHLKHLAIKGCISLQDLNICDNLLDKEQLNLIFQDLPAKGGNTFISHLNNPGSVFAEAQILKLKKWL